MSQDADARHPGPAHDHRAHSTDSAGQPWQGRSFEPNPHAADDGSADPALLAALTAFRAGEGDEVAIVDAYRAARLLIPLVAEKGAIPQAQGPDHESLEVGAHGLPVDKTQELSIVTVAAPDGRRILPVFTSVETLGRWDAAARPIPVEGVRTALAAAGDETDLIVIDPASDTEFVLRRPAVWAIGQSLTWEPSYRSPEVYAALQRSIAGELAVIDLAVAPGDPTGRLRGPELVVELQLMAGLDQAELDAVLARLAHRWAADDRIAVLVDSLTVKLRRGA
ncbi:SseB family protein [Microbacterium rhizosphaerae]|uniref:SseB family protein n=1 Tax=Microbacterium rhizosphaerae TaxID=1678237 RepID=A0ABZ0STU1_9MICO|nr:SseB family protein [Microbacterium rhizosphaerae]WPR91052.1 SseB family protein [Microbacterium rhizosphaerae]